jgi:hypothetical protein
VSQISLLLWFLARNAILLYLPSLVVTQLNTNMSGGDCSYNCAVHPGVITPYTDITGIGVSPAELGKVSLYI